MMCVLLATAIASPAAAAVRIGEAGDAVAVIVVGDVESKGSHIAAADLQDVLKRITGAEFEIVEQTDDTDARTRIFVGGGGPVRAIASDIDFDGLARDEIVMKTVGRDLVLAGGGPRGTVYAVSTFFQDVLGCRWWAPGALTAPNDPDLAVEPLDVRYRPPFELRFVLSQIGGVPEARRWHRLSYDLSFDISPRGIPSRALRPDRYYADHPEYFAYLREDGSEDREGTYLFLRKQWKHNAIHEPKPNSYNKWVEVLDRTRRAYNQFCPNSAGARRVITDAVLEELEKNRSAGALPEIVWVAQGHANFMCQCDACEAMRGREGSDSSNWIRMVNAVAAEVAPKFPTVKVGTFAFLHTEAPPATLEPADNVLIYHMLHETNRLDPVTTYPFHADAMRKWARIGTVYVWDYDANYRNYYQPYPNYFVSGQNVKYFHEVGVDGIMVQGGFGKAADLAAMRTWVTAQMMWNPKRDPRTLMIEFLNGYYGAAGPYLMEYIETMVDAAHRKKGLWLGSYAFTTKDWATVRDMNAATRLFNEAAAAVRADRILAQRVWLARKSIDLSWLDRYDEFRNAAREQGLPFLGPANPSKIVDAVAPFRTSWGHWHIGKPFSAYFDEIREKFPPQP